ncbi:peptidase M20 domain-containing protein 2 [Trichonephila clavipes]|nr:peptidase M20 domain-containing protein 2 [Trichonephila clavipes]
MTEQDFRIVCSTIDEEKEFLNSVSQDIWSQPELSYKEFQAHEILTNALIRCNFQVERHYVVPTAFKAEYTSKKEGGPVIAILLEYDALPDIGHACGHNLIAEVGLATSLAIKAAMDADPELPGKLLVLGTPGEEGDGGKIDLLSAGAFRDVDVAMMAHPSTRGLLATDHVILNHGQVTWTTPELAPPLLTPTPHQREDVSALDRFNVHRCPTRRVFNGIGLELVARQATVRYLYHWLPRPSAM